jgi:hypothetical protein
MCSAGKQVLGGGAQVTPLANDNALSQSMPVGSNGWQATFNSTNAATTASLSVWVICANIAP